MCSKEVQIILRDARIAIKSNNFHEAIEKCESLLKDHPENYMAHILLGAAYQYTDKTNAANYLRKAITYAPGPPTIALQGLANCGSPEELPTIYDQLLILLPDKYNEYYDKLYELSISGTTNYECFKILRKEARQTDSERQKLALQCLAKCWLINDFPVGAHEDVFVIALEQIVDDTDFSQHFNANIQYMKLLYKHNDILKCIKRACMMTEMYEFDKCGYELICRIYCEFSNKQFMHEICKVLKEPIDFYSVKLLELDENSDVGLLYKALDLLKKLKYLEARGILYKLRKSLPKDITIMEVLAHTEMKVGAYGMAIHLWEQLNKNGRYEFNYALCLSYDYNLENVSKSKDILLKLESNNDTLNALARCYSKLGETDALKSLPLTDVQTKAEFILDTLDAILLLKSSDSVGEFSSQLLLGELYFKINDYKHALEFAFQATRLKEYRTECFLLLGQIYYATDDVIRSRKSLEKCIAINPQSENAINLLYALYNQINESELNLALLTNSIKYIKGRNSKGFQHKLGLQYLTCKRWDDAIQSFRSAIKYDVGSVLYWEALGDGYAARGSYYSSLRVFKKILGMDEANQYAKLQKALITSRLRMYVQAIYDFDILLEEYPYYLPAIKGAALARIKHVKNLLLQHRYGVCKNHLQTTINLLQKAFLIEENHQMIWLWRLTAVVFMLTARMPKALAHLNVMGKLANRNTKTARLDRPELLVLATRFFISALKLKENTYIWYELALSYYYTAKYVEKDIKKYLLLSQKACKVAIEKAHTRWHNWNLLGVLSMHKDTQNLQLAQHCFIQALKHDRKSYTSWNNLGTLYLHLGEIKLANEAFKRSQQYNPMYPNAWIGQAMVAEIIKEDIEAVDIYRHCQQLHFKTEAAIGFANWTCRLLTTTNPEYKDYMKFIESENFDIRALDAINFYCYNIEDEESVSARSLQGFFHEHHMLYTQAERAYLKAIEKTSVGSARDKMYTNLGYLYLKMNNPQKAVDVFNSVSEGLFKPIVGLALSYFRLGMHQESYSVYNSLLNSVSDEEKNKAASILVAMASMLYASQGETDTKTLLYQCILLKDYPIQALFSACALGLLHKDNQLTEFVLAELKKYENSPEHCAHIAYLMSQNYLQQNEKHKGLVYLMKRLHINANNSDLRKVFLQYLLDNYNHKRQYSISISQMALSATILDRIDKKKKVHIKENCEALLIASKALQNVDKQRAIKLAQCAVHVNPVNQKAWEAVHAMRS